MAHTTNPGSGSFTNSFSGLDSEGKIFFPSGTHQRIGKARGKPGSTNDWCPSLLKENHADNLFTYTMTRNTTNYGFEAIQTDILSSGI